MLYVTLVVAFIFWAISEAPKPHMSNQEKAFFNNGMKAIALIATYTALVELFWVNMNNGWVVTFTFATFVAFATTLSARMFNVTARDKPFRTIWKMDIATGLVGMTALMVALVSLVPTVVHLFKTLTPTQGFAVVVLYLTWAVVDETLQARRAEAGKKSRHINLALFLLTVLVFYIAAIVLRALY